MAKKNQKYWFLALTVLGLAYLAWSIYQLINAVAKIACAGHTIIKPTLLVLCNTDSTFFIPFGIAVGLIAMIVGIYNYAKLNK